MVKLGAAGSLMVLSVGALGLVTQAAGHPDTGASARAHDAGVVHVVDSAHLRLTKASGSLLHEAGPVSGTLSGSMQATLEIGASFSGEFTIYTRSGTVTGHGLASPHGSGRYQSFAGSMVVTGGSGRYAHVHGHGGLYGTFDRRTFAFVIQTTGALSS
jgi:hypothetical protein